MPKLYMYVDYDNETIVKLIEREKELLSDIKRINEALYYLMHGQNYEPEVIEKLLNGTSTYQDIEDYHQ